MNELFELLEPSLDPPSFAAPSFAAPSFAAPSPLAPSLDWVVVFAVVALPPLQGSAKLFATQWLDTTCLVFKSCKTRKFCCTNLLLNTASWKLKLKY